MKSKRQAKTHPGYYQSANGLMVTHALGHMMYGCEHYVPKCMSYHEAIGVYRESTLSVF